MYFHSLLLYNGIYALQFVHFKIYTCDLTSFIIYISLFILHLAPTCTLAKVGYFKDKIFSYKRQFWGHDWQWSHAEGSLTKAHRLADSRGICCFLVTLGLTVKN